jgi:hypothetical protein
VPRKFLFLRRENYFNLHRFPEFPFRHFKELNFKSFRSETIKFWISLERGALEVVSRGFKFFNSRTPVTGQKGIICRGLFENQRVRDSEGEQKVELKIIISVLRSRCSKERHHFGGAGSYFSSPQ